jgi:hypothetical protein
MRPVNSHFAVFEGEQFRMKRRSEPRITLFGARSTFYLNGLAWETMGRPAAVEFMFDANVRKIAIRPTDPRKKNAFKVLVHGKGTFRRISGAAFCQHIRLKVAGTILFLEPEFDSDGMLTLDLNKTTTVSRGAR